MDAGPAALAATLVQTKDNIRRVISYASRSLTPVETRYSQTEKEALSCIYGCEHFSRYLLGCEFDLITDHQPLQTIFGNPRAKLPARIERWGLRFMAFKHRVVHIQGNQNPSDYLSRHTAPTSSAMGNLSTKLTERYINFVVDSATPKAINIDAIKQATETDTTLQRVLEVMQSGCWQAALSDSSLRPFYNVRDELCTDADHSIVLRGWRIVLPQSLQQQAINLAHQGHQGLVRTKQLLRQKVWFPRIDQMTADTVKACIACQATTPEHHSEPISSTTLPSSEWTQLSADFAGPLPSGEYLLVIIDDFSSFPVVEILHSTTARAVIPALDRIFALLGKPETLKTDNGPPWNSQDLDKFAKYLGYCHRKVTPLWPAANGEVERFMRTVTKVLRTARIEHRRLENYTLADW